MQGVQLSAQPCLPRYICRGRSRGWIAASLVLGLLLSFTCNPISVMFIWSNCTPKEKILSTQHRPFAAMLLPSAKLQNLPTLFRRSRCKLIEKILRPKYCPLSAMLRNHSLSPHRLRACKVVFYNRVPKCASQTVLGVFKQLACQNGYKYVSETGPQNITKQNVASIAHSLMETGEPTLFARHLNFINFSSLNLQEPVYINVIRDPVQRAISHYYYNAHGSNQQPFTQPRRNFNTSLDECAGSGKGACWSMVQMPTFFCGHSPVCRMGGSLTLNRAKRTVREKYLLVGVTEDLPAFMETLSYLIPHFFSNATAVYNSLSGGLWQKSKTLKKQNISNETVAILHKHLGTEIEFYKFARQRFYYIHRSVQRSKKGGFLRGLLGDVSLDVQL